MAYVVSATEEVMVLVFMPSPYMALSLVHPEVTFVLPKHKIQDVLREQQKLKEKNG